ncbi:MAG TPA: tRNA lysidine(34) synthetase TilS [Microbacteriaceae bacterium]|nr:tRNA lysidine(34) synthetase TilS [Microbacteriaceae bacterium]
MDTDSTRRPRLTPARADVRRAVRGVIAGLEPGALVSVALSGGADSLALAAALAFEAPRAGLRAGAFIVDHALQSGSADVARRAAEQARTLGLDPVEVLSVRVDITKAGLEADAREARYSALREARSRHGATLVLLAHSRDDQAETVLLGLARGSGTGSLAGMATSSDGFVRPLLGLARATLRQACLDEQLEWWEDPHNSDPRFLRARVRDRVLPMLEAELGPGVAEALARTAEQLREDADAFAQQIDEIIEEIVEPAEAGIAVTVAALAANPAALRQRIIRHVVRSEFGVSLSRTQTVEIARLVTDWHGQGPLPMPGCVVRRVAGRIVFQAVGAD